MLESLLRYLRPPPNLEWSGKRLMLATKSLLPLMVKESRQKRNSSPNARNAIPPSNHKNKPPPHRFDSLVKCQCGQVRYRETDNVCIHFQTKTSIKTISHEPAMNWKIEKRYFPCFTPLLYSLRMCSTKGSYEPSLACRSFSFATTCRFCHRTYA